MEPELILKQIVEHNPQNIYRILARECVHDKMKSLQLIAEIYQNILEHQEESEKCFGAKSVKDIIRLVHLN